MYLKQFEMLSIMDNSTPNTSTMMSPPKKRSIDLGHLSSNEKQCILNMYKQQLRDEPDKKINMIVFEISKTLDHFGIRHVLVLRHLHSNFWASMLTKHVTLSPLTKFIIIEDSVQERAGAIFRFILQNHVNSGHQLHYFVFEENFRKVQRRIADGKVTIHNMTTKLKDFPQLEDIKQLQGIVSRLNSPSIMFVDSLAHVIYKYGLAETYRAFNSFMDEQKVVQIATVFHTDLLECSERVEPYFEHLATLWIRLEGKSSMSAKSRVSYTFKKGGGKIVKKIEEYWFEDDVWKTKELDKPDVQKLIQQGLNPVSPEDMSTFKISLTENEKQQKEQVVLPYLPKLENEEGKIIYQLDEVDDWDEEDPDDDLDM